MAKLDEVRARCEAALIRLDELHTHTEILDYPDYCLLHDAVSSAEIVLGEVERLQAELTDDKRINYVKFIRQRGRADELEAENAALCLERDRQQPLLNALVKAIRGKCSECIHFRSKVVGADSACFELGFSLIPKNEDTVFSRCEHWKWRGLQDTKESEG
jgi:hypothetical protein